MEKASRLKVQLETFFCQTMMNVPAQVPALWPYQQWILSRITWNPAILSVEKLVTHL